MCSKPDADLTGSRTLSRHSARTSLDHPIIYCPDVDDTEAHLWTLFPQYSFEATVSPLTGSTTQTQTLRRPFQTMDAAGNNKLKSQPPSFVAASANSPTPISIPTRQKLLTSKTSNYSPISSLEAPKSSLVNSKISMTAVGKNMTAKHARDQDKAISHDSHGEKHLTNGELVQGTEAGHSHKHRPVELESSPRPSKKQKEFHPPSESSTATRLEDLPTFKKIRKVLQLLLGSFHQEHDSNVLLALQKASRAARKSPPPTPKAQATLSKNQQWIYERGVKRAEELYTVRKLPNPLKHICVIWEALFTRPASAKAFYAKVGTLLDHSLSSLQRQARAEVAINGGEVTFRCSTWQDVVGPIFPSFRAIDVPKSSSSNKLGKSVQLSHDIWLGANTTSKTQTHIKATEMNTLRPCVAACPPFKWYRPVQSNTLAQNDKRLRVWPLMDTDATDEQQEMMESELTERFARVNPETRRHHANPLLKLVCRRLSETVIEPFLKTTLRNRCSSEKMSEKNLILQYFLSTSSSLPDTVPAEIRTAWSQREIQPELASENWVLVASSLPDPSSAQLAAATIVCAAFEHETNISLWHWIRPHAEDILRNLVDGNTENQVAAESDMWCRVCFARNCFQHGIISEDQEEEDEEQPFLINLKQPISGRAQSPESSYTNHPKRKDIQLQFPKTQPFMPCSHPGSCEGSNCICFILQRTCEKACHCSHSCDRRFPGCACAKNNRTCATDSCICVASERECDADLCGKCGAAEMLLARDADVPHGCTNVAIQRNIPKRLLTGKSAIRGYGLFMGELTKKHEYISEYKGEIVSRDESGRRGVEYHYQAAQYLWGIDKEQDYDATAVGSKMRFPNHSGDAVTINMHCKTKFCNGVWRVGFWASRTIHPGEELFFNYGYPEDHTRDFWEPGLEKGSSNVAARKSKSRSLKLTKGKGSRSASVTDKAKAKGLKGLTTGPHVTWDDLRGASGSQTVVDSEASSSDVEIGSKRHRKQRQQRGKTTAPPGNITADADLATDNGPRSETRRRVSSRKTRPSAARLAMAESMTHIGEETGAEGDDDMGESDFESERDTAARAGKQRKVARPSRYTR